MSTTEQQRAAANERQRRSREKRRQAATPPVTDIESQPVTLSRGPVTPTDSPVSGECVAVEAVTVAAGRYPPSPVPSGVTPARVERLSNGRFPARRSLVIPATIKQYSEALALMESGETCKAVQKATGATWLAIQERGMIDDPHRWPAFVMAWKEARAGRMIDRAQEILMQETPAATSEASGPMGTTTTVHHKSEPAMLGQALAGLLPETFGKAAGRGTVTVHGNASIYAPVTPGTLDDWIPEGLINQ
ncbi:MAG: hypothetical protein WCS52_00645 [bacterium]